MDDCKYTYYLTSILIYYKDMDARRYINEENVL